MQIKTLFKISAVAGALILAGCGGDVNITPTVNDNSTTTTTTTNNGGNGGGTTTPTNPCAKRGDLQGEFDGTDCKYDAAFASKNVEITEDIAFTKLDNGGVHAFTDALLIGKDCDTTTGCNIANGPTLTVAAGATLAFASGEAIIRIARGAKINAIGTAADPITFTATTAIDRLDTVGQGPQYADWGGIIINGNGITNQCTDAQRDGGTCNVPSEGIVSYFGGNNNADSSGSIEFAKIWYAGSGPRTGGQGDDLNSLTLNAVGSGSSFDYIHIHQGFDDGIEFFGGASTISHIVVTDTQDDAIDIDAGWQGKAQYLFVQHGTVNTREGATAFMGNNGFETDGEKNGGADYSQAPASNPTIANVTVITTDGSSVRDNDPSQAFKFDDAIQGEYYNVLMVKTDGTNGTDCVEFKSDGEKSADKLSFTSGVMACINEFKGGDFGASAPAALQATAKSAWFDNGGKSERIGGNATVLAANGFATDTSSTDITVAATDLSMLNDSFFQGGNFIGAVSDQDTSSDWYNWVDTALKAAAQD